MRDEQHPGPVESAAELAVVERGDHRLARAGGGDHQVVGAAPAALDLELFEDLALEGVGLNGERRGRNSNTMQRVG